ncbi:hypothetical protein IAT38_000217 [Cryptococcus sp. DSM 104549]
MFIAIIGTPSAGKRTVLEYLEKKYGFRRVGLQKDKSSKANGDGLQDSINGLSVSSPAVDAATPSSPLNFTDNSELLEYITRNWLSHYVTTDLRTFEEIDPFVKRPFFLLVSVDGPLLTRFEREKTRASEIQQSLTLEDFVASHDTLLNGAPLPTQTNGLPSLAHAQPISEFRRTLALAQVHVTNNFPDVSALHWYLDRLDLLDEERLRPGWDTYFMTLASLASHRSNCMKRRVGALLVRSKRILSTGYNGTPRGTRNCNQGGCRRCNGSAKGGEALNECLCLHAEENALMEAGRDRIGDDSVIYCNTCPCLRCSVKIVQCGVREVVYNQSYSMDEASAMVLKEGGVILRQLHMPGAL